jgi:ATP-dependent DNA helicase Rep
MSAPAPSHGLNLAQQEAVNYLHGPCLVLAGAGSGKTRVITHKIGRLIQMGMPAQRIAAITFTNKAAAEMRERAKGLIGRAAKDVLVCTFHALGVRMLRQDGAALGLKAQFSILDTDDVTSILKDAGGSTDAATARQWQWTISGWKSAGLNAQQALAQAEDDNARITATVMARYEERLTAYQSVDFDDLISLPLKLLQNHEQVRQKWQAQMGHILVDEYQDTNATQYEMLKLLVGGNVADEARFTAVGDDDQSIYGWRGATLDNLKKLPIDFPALKVIKLEQNYRSTSAILRAANNVIGPNPKLFPKNLWSDLGEGEPVRVVDADNEEHEAERAVARIQSLRAEGALAQTGKQFKEFRHFAVLYRANHQAKPFEKALRRAGIPYKVSGGQSFFDRAEIRDLCAWFRLWANNDDDPAFLRAVTTPKRGIGHQTLGTLGLYASQYKLSLFEALFAFVIGGGLGCQGTGQPARVWPLCERPAVPRPPDRRRRGRATFHHRLAEGHWLRAAPVRRRRQRKGRRRQMDQCDGVLRLDGPALRRASGRCGGSPPPKKSKPAGGVANHCLALHHQRARERPGCGDLVDPARLQGPGVAACAAGRREPRACCPSSWRTAQTVWVGRSQADEPPMTTWPSACKKSAA